MENEKIYQTFTEKDIHNVFSKKDLEEAKKLLEDKISDKRLMDLIANSLSHNGFTVLQSSILPRGTVVIGVGEISKFKL